MRSPATEAKEAELALLSGITEINRQGAKPFGPERLRAEGDAKKGGREE